MWLRVAGDVLDRSRYKAGNWEGGSLHQQPENERLPHNAHVDFHLLRRRSAPEHLTATRAACAALTSAFKPQAHCDYILGSS